MFEWKYIPRRRKVIIDHSKYLPLHLKKMSETRHIEWLQLQPLFWVW